MQALEEILGDESLLHDFVAFAHSMLSDDLVYFIIALRPILQAAERR